MKITINNTFHGTSVNLIVKNGDPVTITQTQVKRAEKELCGTGCKCGSMWSYNQAKIEDYEDFHFEPLVDSRTGETVGAKLVQN